MQHNKRKSIAFIPLRGGSKGIPGKNIKTMAGKPLLCHVVDAALAASEIDTVVVATDSEVIRQVVQQYYPNHPKLFMFDRDASTATDTASTESAMLDFAKRYTGDFDHIVLIQATSPLLEAKHLDEGIQKYKEQRLGGLVSVVRQKRFTWDDRNPLNYNPQTRLSRQEFEGYLVENGAFYITSKDRLMQSGCRISSPYGNYEMPEASYFEIDEPEDWIIVEALLKEKQTRQKLEKLPYKIEAVVLDFDGVFTNNKVIVFQSGEEAVICDRGDGMGISMLKKAGIHVWVISTEQNPVLTARCKKLDIPCFYGINNKWELLQTQLKEKNINPKNVVYLGNDINDMECMQNVGCGVAVADACNEVLAIADIVLENKGGDGAIRELGGIAYQPNQNF